MFEKKLRKQFDKTDLLVKKLQASIETCRNLETSRGPQKLVVPAVFR